MGQVSTNDVFDALVGQLQQEVGDRVDDIIIFDGPLSVALAEHFAAAKGGSRFLFLTLADAITDASSGYGLPVREGLLVDIYGAFRVVGRGRYEETRGDLWDLSDIIVHEAFLFDRRTPDMKSSVMGTQFVTRARALADGDVIAQLMRFNITPGRHL